MPEEAASKTAASILVLLVDDEESQMELTKLNLENANHSLTISISTTPEEALKHLSDQTFDCVVSDYQMPGMNGIQFCKEVRKTSKIPFIIYTARGSEEVASEAFAAGIDDYVMKEPTLAHLKVLARRITHVVEKNRAEEASLRSGKLLHQSNELLEAVTKGTKVIIAAQDTSFHYTFFNDAYRDEIKRLSGKTIQIGSSMVDTFAHLSEQQKISINRWTKALRGETVNEEVEFGDKQNVRLYQTIKTPLRNISGDIIGVGEVAYDITEQRKMKSTLKESEEKYLSLYTSMVEGVALHEIIKNQNGEPVDYLIIDVNPAYESITGLKKADVVGKLASKAYGMGQPPYLDIYARVVATGRPESFETYFPPMDKHLSISTFTSGKERFATVFQDISHRKKAEKEARRLNNTLSVLNDSNRVLIKAPDERSYLDQVCSIIIKNTDYHLVWVGFAEDDDEKRVRPVAYAGFDDGYIAQMKITWDDNDRGRGPTGTAIRTGKVTICRDMLTDPKFEPWRTEAIKIGYASSIVFPLINAGRSYGAISIYSSEVDPWSSEEVNLLQQLADDISLGVISIRERLAKQLAEESLKSSNEELLEINKELTDIEKELSDANLRVQEYASSLEKMVGERTWKLRESEEKLRAFMDSTDLGFAMYDSDLNLLDLNRVALGWALIKTPPAKTKKDLIGRNVLVVFPGIEKSEAYLAYKEVIKTGKSMAWEGVSTVSEEMWMSSSAFRVGSGLGVICRDISGRRRGQEALRRAEVASAVEQMGATVAHDLRGPLGQVVQAVNMIKQDPSLTPRMLKIVEENAVRSLKMIADWRSSTRELVPQPINTDLSSLIKNVLEGSSIPANIEVATSIEEELESINIDPDIMHRVLDNLVKNAVEAMPNGGKLTLKARKVANELEFNVIDTGVGIPEDSRKRIFSPLYTTKAGGMGLGLTFCKRAVEVQGGSIDFKSELGVGTIFTVKLPSKNA